MKDKNGQRGAAARLGATRSRIQAGRGGDPTARSQSGAPALISAAKEGHWVEGLAGQSDFSARDESGLLALDCAAREGERDCVELLARRMPVGEFASQAPRAACWARQNQEADLAGWLESFALSREQEAALRAIGNAGASIKPSVRAL